METQLAVRPKVASAGLSLRSGRAKPAKAVYFRPNATALPSASGVEVRRITPLAVATTPRPRVTPTTLSDGISFAARVVSDVNPLAEERARKATAAAARSRRQSSYTSGSSSYSFRSSSSSGHSDHSGPEAAAPGPGLLATAPGGSHSQSSSTSSRTLTRQLADGHTVTVSETEDFQSSLGPDSKAPTASRLLTVLLSGH